MRKIFAPTGGNEDAMNDKIRSLLFWSVAPSFKVDEWNGAGRACTSVREELFASSNDSIRNVPFDATGMSMTTDRSNAKLL